MRSKRKEPIHKLILDELESFVFLRDPPSKDLSVKKREALDTIIRQLSNFLKYGQIPPDDILELKAKLYKKVHYAEKEGRTYSAKLWLEIAKEVVEPLL